MGVPLFINMRPMQKSDFDPSISELKRGRGNSSCLYDTRESSSVLPVSAEETPCGYSLLNLNFLFLCITKFASPLAEG